ncbi:FmdB family zinc ribbon protein [Thermomonospora cellulosilytica]|uniref:Putative FmdB family regulatory protein n=2 Tax=Thermomonospora TaxID=2019 RepID=A0A7W3N1J6_9ACTN|nr:zinc ribbon domain-containing protein [Thermomonospora cellulosilytica]MBA9005844.1 putative FmdB family regulatory protein [Thermomonospora cellulosilytica]
MAIYQYRCPKCGPFEVIRPLGEAGRSQRCGGCGGTARRVFTAPMLVRTPRPLARALAAQEASAYEPAVVDRVPPGRRPASSADPPARRRPTGT